MGLFFPVWTQTVGCKLLHRKVNEAHKNNGEYEDRYRGNGTLVNFILGMICMLDRESQGESIHRDPVPVVGCPG